MAKAFEWTRSETLGLSRVSCTSCHGLGLVVGKRGTSNPCHCVLRSIFRACHEQFVACACKEKYMSRVSWALIGVSGRDHHFSWSRKVEEYIADFEAVTRRHLCPEDYRLFRLHFLLRSNWQLCCRRMGITRGNYYHAIYRIEAELGRVYRELQPYSLFPLDEYFSSPRRLAVISIAENRPRVRPFAPPLARTATGWDGTAA